MNDAQPDAVEQEDNPLPVPGRSGSSDSNNAPGVSHGDPLDAQPEKAQSGLGIPCAKRIVDPVGFLVIVASVVCCSISICSITPSLKWGWRLGFKYQIVVVGLLISIMGICLQNVLLKTFAIVEVRWGRSTLQNLEALLRNTSIGPGTEFWWRIAIFVLTIVPPSLSVAYKQFIGGESTQSVDPGFRTEYGLLPPTNTSIEFSQTFTNAPYLFINATSDFFERSAIDDDFPQTLFDNGSAVPYGYNLLLLSNRSAGVLDIPRLSHLNAIKNQLRSDESWVINASVYGLVTNSNDTIDTWRTDDEFWKTMFASKEVLNSQGLASFAMFRNWTSMGMIPFVPNQTAAGSLLLGSYYPSKTYWNAYYQSAEDDDVQAFRKHAYLFTTHRQICKGSWVVTKNSLRLLGGECPPDREHIDSAMFSANITNLANFRLDGLTRPFPLDSLPMLVHTLDTFVDTRAMSPWKLPSYAMAVASTYWARDAYVFAKAESYGQNLTAASPDFLYASINETMVSTRSTLQASTSLYLILAIQPIITVLAFLLNIALYSTPIGKDFGLVSILSGIRPESLPLLEGAGFSGRLRESVFVGISVVAQHVKYDLSVRASKGHRASLTKKTDYH